MSQLARGLPLVPALIALALAATPASAAKGIKKNGQYLTQGTVTSVHRLPQGHTLTIMTHHPKRKKLLGGALGNRQVPETFTVDRFTRVTGGALQQGRRVSVAASGQHANTVSLIQTSRTSRRRTPTYYRRTIRRTVVVRQGGPRTTVVRVPAVTRVTNVTVNEQIVNQRVNQRVVSQPTTVQHHTNAPHQATQHHTNTPHPAAAHAHAPARHAVAPAHSRKH